MVELPDIMIDDRVPYCTCASLADRAKWRDMALDDVCSKHPISPPKNTSDLLRATVTITSKATLVEVESL